MAITLKDYPAKNIFRKNYIHQTTYPVYYTSTSDGYVYSDFRYKYKLYDVDGLYSTTKQAPRIKNATGVFDVSQVLQNFFETTDFDPTITEFTAVEGLKQYVMKVEEFSNDISSPAEETYTKCIGINNSIEDWDYNDYTLNYDNKKMLTNHNDLTIEMSLEEEATKRFLNGTLRNGSYTIKDDPTPTQNSLIYEILIKIYRGTQTLIYKSYDNNPFWNLSYNQGLSSNNTTIESMDGRLLDFGTGPKNINNTYWIFRGIEYPGGWIPGGNVLVTTPILTEGDEYEINAYCWPNGNNGHTSRSYRYKVVEDCPHRTRFNFTWFNRLGGFDNFIFDRVYSKENKMKRNNYRKNKDSINSNEYMTNTNYSRGEKTFNTSIDTVYSVRSNWLSDDEIDYLEDLTYSEDVYVSFDGKWYPIIIENDDFVIDNNNPDLRSYVIEFRLSNKKYI